MSTKTSQKDAVFNAIKSVLEANNIHFEEGSSAGSLMTKELRAEVNSTLVEGFQSGSIELDSPKTEKELKAYASGLQSNWLKKDKRLNGGVAYMPKNPGSRTGQNDPQIKALRALLSTKTDPAEIEEIQGYIDQRLEVLAANKKTKSVTVDFTALPEELQTKYSK